MKAFSRDFAYLDIKELIEYYAVFDGFWSVKELHNTETLLQNIEINILKNYDSIKDNFIMHSDPKIQSDIEKLLFRIGVGNRKIYSIYKNDISQFHGSLLYQILFDRGIITKEYSREKPLRTDTSKQIKKEFRRYQIEDKIKFTKNFYRFWSIFIAPNKILLQNAQYDKVLQKIADELDKYTSLTFERLCNDLILHSFSQSKITQSGSYWDKNIELDLLTKTKDGKIIAGEAKWKNQKISKNTLNKLQKKCALAELKVDYFALFSKSGFSNELLKYRDKNILLYDLNSFIPLRFQM